MKAHAFASFLVTPLSLLPLQWLENNVAVPKSNDYMIALALFLNIVLHNPQVVADGEALW